ncbi:MAG: gamma-glutamylcyclotransferase family protein [Pseudomonadota bacterium]
MPTVLYFAYGSNMMTARLQARCPSARPAGVAFAENHRLTFWKKGRDGSGKGHLTSSAGTRQPGVLFTLAAQDLIALDGFEGAGSGYRRVDDFTIRRRDDDRLMQAATYLATDLDEHLRPFDWYLGLILAGAREHAFDYRMLRELAAVAWREDPEPARATRHEAIGLFAKAGLSVANLLRPL